MPIRICPSLNLHEVLNEASVASDNGKTIDGDPMPRCAGDVRIRVIKYMCKFQNTFLLLLKVHFETKTRFKAFTLFPPPCE